MTLTDLIFTALAMLIGKEGKDYSLYEMDDYWWDNRLWMIRN